MKIEEKNTDNYDDKTVIEMLDIYLNGIYSRPDSLMITGKLIGAESQRDSPSITLIMALGEFYHAGVVLGLNINDDKELEKAKNECDEFFDLLTKRFSKTKINIVPIK